MGVAEDFAAELKAEREAQTRRAGPQCTVGRMLETFPDEEQEPIQALIDDRTYTVGMVLTVLERNGHRLGKNALERHRNRACMCRPRI